MQRINKISVSPLKVVKTGALTPRMGSQLSHVLRKLGLMHVRKVSSQISLCSPHRLIRDDTFRLNWIFAKKRLHLNEK